MNTAMTRSMRRAAAMFVALALAAGPAGAVNIAPRAGHSGGRSVGAPAMSGWGALALPVAVTVSFSPPLQGGPVSHGGLVLSPAQGLPLPGQGLPAPVQGAAGFVGQQPAAAKERLIQVGHALGETVNLGQLSPGQARESGEKLAEAMTGGLSFSGQGEAVPAPGAAAASPQGHGFPVSAEPQGIKAQVEWGFGIVEKVRSEVARVVVGQEQAVDAILMALIARRHVLLEGVPGVAKTTMAKAVAGAVEGRFQRLQGTPDTMPADIRGSQILQRDLETGRQYLETVPGPVFANLFLADEINRMVPKAQSALLEAMEEGQVTLGGKTHKLERLTVIATQNPVEQEGTYRLPEAQVDRFFLKVIIHEPSEDEDIEVGRRNESIESQPTVSRVTSLAEIDRIRQIAASLPLSNSLERYIVKIARAAAHQLEFKKFVEYSVSTRASIYLRQAARIHALMQGRSWVMPSDVKAVAPLILRHRTVLNYQTAGRMTVEELIQQILDRTPFEDEDNAD